MIFRSVVRNDLVATRLEQREDLFVGRRCCQRCSARSHCRLLSTTGLRRFHVTKDDAAVRTGSQHAREIDIGFLGDASGKR